MRILITGGTGFIGRSLCRALRGESHELVVLSRRPQTVATLCSGAAAISSLDALSPDQYFDAVVNLAGAPIFGPRWTEARKAALRDSRVTLTEHLVAQIAAMEHKPSVLLSGSAIGYYGDRGDDNLLEDAAPGSGFGAQLCQDWEQAAQAAEAHGVRVCLLRTSLVIGPGGGFLQRMLTPFKFGLGGRIGSGRQWMSWIHRDDHVAIMRHLLDTPTLSGPFNLAAPNPVSNQAFTECLAKLLKRPALLPLPAALLRLALGEQAGLLLGGQRVLPGKLSETGFTFTFPLLEDALRDVLQSN